MSREKEIFAQALELSGAQRVAFLDQACQGDAECRVRVEALLQSAAQVGDFLRTPPAVRTGGGEVPSEMIGRYKLLEPIGEGGCGVVYLAEQQEPIRRRVALKVVKLGMDTNEVIARFEAERQALALMDHPNIARVYDCGATETGRPYFVMELVSGVSITRYCDDRRLPLAERLALFLAVCRAIQHAHEKGIVHRDIKPSNILVALYDGQPVPKVIDFGVAKATEARLTDRTMFTAAAQFIGTPAYMSPEQADQGAVDARSDVYALGVLLYELLTGFTPFAGQDLTGAGLEAMRRRMREEVPPLPSEKVAAADPGELAALAGNRRVDPAKLAGLLRGDLDRIVMHCIEKDSAGRYATAVALAADVGNYLNHEPITAPAARRGRSSVGGRAKGLMAGGLALIAVLLGASGLVRWTEHALVPDVPAPAIAAEARSPARILADRSRAMSVDAFNSTADDYLAAEGLIKQALELDSNDGEIWAISSQLNLAFYTRGFDESLTRVAAARAQAERAVRLSPDSVEAHFALGNWQAHSPSNYEEGIATLRGVIAKEPGHARALMSLGQLLLARGQVEQAFVLFERARAISRWAPLVDYLEFLYFFGQAKFADADRAIRRSIAAQPSFNAVAGQAMLALTWKGDVEEAAREMDSVPAAMRDEHRIVLITALVQIDRRNPEAVLEALNRIPDDYIQDNFFSGPKDFLVGWAQALAGRPEAARVAWESGLAIVDERLKTGGSDLALHVRRGELLACLNREEGALKEARTVEEIERDQPGAWRRSPAMIYAALGRGDLGVPMLKVLLEQAPGGSPWPLTPALLRIDPTWDKLRGDPEFQKLAAGPPATAPVKG
jgi:tetratricopeptide (TPR) repeat protein